jgi:hypothetical protein
LLRHDDHAIGFKGLAGLVNGSRVVDTAPRRPLVLSE